MSQPVERSERTRWLIAEDREYVWHPFTPMKAWCERADEQNIIIERGEREWLIDTDGNRYIDGVSSIWCNVWGHCVPELDEALHEQLGKIAHSTLLGLGNVPSIELAKKMITLTHQCGLSLDTVFYSDNGSTAVEVACKMAYQFWRNVGRPQKQRFIGFENAYHGDTIGAVSLGGIPTFHSAFKGLCFQADFVSPTDALSQIKKLLEQHASQYAAVVMEPLIMGAGGMITHPPGLLKDIRRLCDQYEVLLICDEVMTGFGRTGRMFACEHEQVTPDLLCLSKGLTAGYMPLGITMTTRKIYDAFYADPNEGKTFFHGHTFTGHPLACAVAIRSLELFQERDLLHHVETLSAILKNCLSRAKTCRYVREVRQCGLIGAIDLYDPATQENFPPHERIGGKVCMHMRKFGLMMRPLADTLILMPPLATTQENMTKLCEGVLASLDAVEEIAGKF